MDVQEQREATQYEKKIAQNLWNKKLEWRKHAMSAQWT